MKVKDVMTPSVHTCRPEDSLHRAAQVLWEHDCGCVPVVDGEGIVRAMLTDRDICIGAYMRGLPLTDLRVADSMSSSIVTCRPEDDLSEAARRMCRHEVRRLPVVDGAGRIQGLLSLNDMANAAGEAGNARDGVAAETLRLLTAVCRHRDAHPAGPELRQLDVPAQPARRGRTKAAPKAGGRKVRRSRS